MAMSHHRPRLLPTKGALCARSPLAWLLCLPAFAACVGPRYVRPEVATPSAFKEAAPAAYAATPAGVWQPAQPQDALLKGNWWELFNEPELNALEQELNSNNQTVAQYYQNYMAARAQVQVARASYFPTLSVDPSATRAKQSSRASTGALIAGSTSAATSGTAGGFGGTTSNNFALPLEASWEPDLFGRIRNTVRQYRYAAQASAADLQNERLAAQAALAQYYFELRGQDSLWDVYQRSIQADRESLQLTQALFETGIDSDQDVAQAQVTLDTTQANALSIATNRAVFEHAIATLIGKPAASFSLPVRLLSTATPQFPIGVPSLLLQRRPDIAAAERTMAEANATIGIQKAAYFPTLSLTAAGGFESSTLSSLLSAPAQFWSLGATASELLFDAGARRATVVQYTALYQADVAAYRGTVLSAFQQVEDELATVRITSEQIQRQQAAVKSAQRYLDLATVRYSTGIDPYLDVMTAEVTLLNDQESEVSLRVTELTATVQLIEALGGGWEASKLTSSAE